ncbi:hypothetical protein HPB51_015751 [Rhipicephalus microplus]|uniref:YqaJ viral recombinase domain-containing protein n=1 Tax=Rhipicephalus microplus TaxID=6941 RepID=A0A9J6ETU8_RHIMP|nr:hypothetical protein HPB51_015751 [Rhipicephalus microplus]
MSWAPPLPFCLEGHVVFGGGTPLDFPIAPVRDSCDVSTRVPYRRFHSAPSFNAVIDHPIIANARHVTSRSEAIKEPAISFSFSGHSDRNEDTMLKRCLFLTQLWKVALLQEMTEAGEQEKRLAEAAGDFCEDGSTPWITVVVDGGWSHRSHGHRYSANSGLAVIVGKRTQKLLYLGVKNKLCSTCEYYSKKGQTKEHTCYRNWNQSSGTMEADILVEGFQRSTEMHGVQYRTFIGDGDSSVYYQLQTKVEYGRFMKKNVCANHVVKCYTSRLYSIAKESKGTRSLLSAPRIKRIKNGARKAVSHYAKILRDCNGSTEDLKKEKSRLIQELASDLRNGPLHVFGSHDGCKSYFCNGSKADNVYQAVPKIQQVKLMSAANMIADKADRLIADDTSNLAEAIMSLVAKFSGGKQINRCQKGSYEHRCQGAGLHFQLGPEWHVKASKAVTCASPAATLKKYTQRRFEMKRQTMSRKRRLFEESGHRERRYNNHAASNSAPHYGASCQKPDMSAAVLSANTERQLQDLQVDDSKRASIEEETRGQASSPEWHEQRRLRLTASNFYAVCTRKDSTPCDALVKRLLQPKGFTTAATEHGKQHESVALQLYATEKETVVQPCGLFIDLKHWFLAATPDGLVGTDRIVEVKCPLKYKEHEPLEAARNFSEKKQRDGTPVLSRSHSYFYQVQGQLHITGRIICDFVVYTTKGIHVQEIRRDDAFWRAKMEPFLLRFYKDCILPEIVDSRLARSMDVRHPEWNRLAIEAKKKTKNGEAPKAKRAKYKKD